MTTSATSIPTSGIGDVNHLYVSALKQIEKMHAAYLARVKQEFVTQLASGIYVADCVIPYPSPAHEALADVVSDIFEKMAHCKRSIDRLQTSLEPEATDAGTQEEAINNQMVVPSAFEVEKASVDATLAAQTQQILRSAPAHVEDAGQTVPETHSLQQAKGGLRGLSRRIAHLAHIKARLADLENIKDIVVTTSHQFSDELANGICELAIHHVSKQYRFVGSLRADYYEQQLSTIEQLAPSYEEAYRSEQVCIQPLIEAIFTAPSFEGPCIPCVALIEKTANTLRLSSRLTQQKTVAICPEAQDNMRNYFKQSFDRLRDFQRKLWCIPQIRDVVEFQRMLDSLPVLSRLQDAVADKLGVRYPPGAEYAHIDRSAVFLQRLVQRIREQEVPQKISFKTMLIHRIEQLCPPEHESLLRVADGLPSGGI